MSKPQPMRDSRTARPWALHAAAGAVGCALLAAAAGCRPSDLDAEYGVMSGNPGRASVNGTSVLAAMFEDSGFRVHRWKRLSPRLQREHVLVWAPNDLAPPGLAQRTYLENWLAAGGRTLVYIGRDYDAEIDYWDRIRGQLAGQQAIQADLRRAQAAARMDQMRYEFADPAKDSWFRIDPRQQLEKTGPLDGPWSDGLNTTNHALKLGANWMWPDEDGDGSSTTGDAATEAPFEREVLLRVAGEPFVWRCTRPSWSESQILFVRNGSMLLNLPLVHPTHRQLAGRVIGACGGERVTFLESQPGGPPVLEQDTPSILGLEAFRVWPLSVILMHWTAVGLLFCLSVFPIFGRPRRAPEPITSDFGAHVEALGKLLQQRGDRSLAQQRVQHARQLLGIKDEEVHAGSPFAS